MCFLVLLNTHQPLKTQIPTNELNCSKNNLALLKRPENTRTTISTPQRRPGILDGALTCVAVPFCFFQFRSSVAVLNLSLILIMSAHPSYALPLHRLSNPSSFASRARR